MQNLADTYGGGLWLDHDLGGDDTIPPVASCLVELAPSAR
jgi:hypothetical protein